MQLEIVLINSKLMYLIEPNLWTELKYLTRRMMKTWQLLNLSRNLEHSLIHKMSLVVMEDGNSALPSNSKHQILLSSKTHFVTLLIKHAHKNIVLGNNIPGTLTALREQF